MLNIRGLAYIVAETTDLKRWSDYARNVLGMMVSDSPDGGLHVKMDERQFRISVQSGSRNGYVASAWELLDREAFQSALGHLSDKGVAYELGDQALCAKRCVQQLAAIVDPSGNRHELVWGFKSDFQHFASPTGVSGFITGDLGLGHTVLPAPNFDATVAFVKDVMGFGLSDLFNFKPGGDAGPVLPIHFFHCGNARHHSLALAGFPVESGCVHVMVEVESMPEVGRAMDRRAADGAKLTATLGQHTNDKMTSFYMQSPSGFDVEFGYGGAVCDWQEHIVHEFTRVSLWGHDFSVGQQG
jgi:3,4-dihydroxy-9,10-secoandrosta-1,3,5(10)-triene-9,17-dione 4,5-dioxygenase